MAIDLMGGIEQLESMGFYDVVLPFLLIFTLFFAILEKVKIFGENSTKFNGLIALVAGILLVRQGDLVYFINTYLPNVSAVVVVFLGFLIILGLFGVKSSAFKGGIMVVFVLVSLVGGIWALTQATEGEDIELPWLPWLGEQEITEEDAGALLVIGIFVLIAIVALVYKPKKSGWPGILNEVGKIGDKFAR